MAISFSCFEIFLNRQKITSKHFQTLLNNSPYSISLEESKHYAIYIEKITSDFYWIHAKYGSKTPWESDVYNSSNVSYEKNPRTKDQIEMKNHFYAMYCKKKNYIYISNSNQRNIITQLFQTQFAKPLKFQSIICSIDEFISTTKILNEIHFTRRRSLFTYKDDVFTQPVDSFGLGSPEAYQCKLSYKVPLTIRFANALKKIKKNHERDNFEELIFIGEDENGAEKIFNLDALRTKIKIEANEDENGTYDPKIIKEALYRRLENLYDDI